MISSGLAGAALALSACSSYATAEPRTPVVVPDTPVPQDVARVCVVRTSPLARAVAFPTRDNGVLVGATRGPTYFCYHAAPGAHDLVMTADNQGTATLLAQAGQSYTLKQEVDFIFGVVNVRPVWVAPEAAHELLQGSSYEVLVEVPGQEKLPDPRAVIPAKP